MLTVLGGVAFLVGFAAIAPGIVAGLGGLLLLVYLWDVLWWLRGVGKPN
jgi:hypothetical protein